MIPIAKCGALLIFFLLPGCLAMDAPASREEPPPTPNEPGSVSPADTPIPPEVFQALMDDDIRLGNESAPVVIIEFADFQCPYSRKWWMESLRMLEEEYVETGRVQFVFRDFPLRIHPAAQISAEAAECARAQGKWREMHDTIFREQRKEGDDTISFGPEEIRQWAGRIEGMDFPEWEKCFAERKYRAEVQKDVQDAKALNITATPTFILGKRGGNGQIMHGAYRYEDLKETIENLVKE